MVSDKNWDVSRRKALRKRRIARDIYRCWASLIENGGWEYYDNLHQYSKNKIHCSCPYCNANIKSRMEEKITQLLINENYNFERQKTFKWLKYKKNLYLDFFLPDYNIAIEYQGNQHFKPISLWGGEQELYLRKERDKVKRKLCNQNIIIKFVFYNN